MRGAIIDASARSRLPRDPAAKIIEVFQAGIALLGKQHIYEVWDAFFDAETRIRTTQIGADPTGSHENHRP